MKLSLFLFLPAFALGGCIYTDESSSSDGYGGSSYGGTYHSTQCTGGANATGGSSATGGTTAGTGGIVEPPPPPPPECTELLTETACTDRADCTPIYAGTDCTCGPDCTCIGGEPGCVCESYGFLVCLDAADAN